VPSPESLFDARLRADPGGPLVTFYDDATGERAELSAKSLANWVAKTHFLLQDSLGLGPGDRALVALPVHWLAAPILLGCWFAGLEVLTVDSPEAESAAVVFADAGSLAGLPAAPDVFAVSMLSMARPDVPPAGAEDYALSVRPMPDSWAGVRAQAGPDDAALDGLSRAELAELAGARAIGLGLPAGGRLLWSGQRPLDWVSALLAPLAVAGSVVLVRNGDRAKLTGRAEAERATSLA
jgi:uncharacterized protein (TIGR03089 family)